MLDIFSIFMRLCLLPKSALFSRFSLTPHWQRKGRCYLITARHKGKKKGRNGPFKHGAPCGPVCMTCHIQLNTGLTTETNQKVYTQERNHWIIWYMNMSSQVDFSISLQKTIFRNNIHHLLSTYYIPGEAHVEGSEGRFQTTASKELKPSTQQPVRNWIQLTTT
ncbi:uncharacterized protein AAG666_001202 isoform 2-T2 [Megaptera novaeangliae]